MNPSSDDFKIIIPKETNWNIVFFLSIWLLFWIAGMVWLTIICILLISQQHIYDIIATWFFFFFAGSFFLYVFLWQCFGKEILIVNKDCLVIKKTGTLSSGIKKIEKGKLIRIDFDSDMETAGWIKFWGLGGGKIVIQYKENKIKFGNSLIEPPIRQVRFGQSATEFEAKQICEKIRLQINT